MSRLVPISAIAEISPSFPKGLKLNQDSLVSFLPMAAVSENGNIIAQDERRLGEVSKGYTYFANGDVLMAKITPCMENGKATFVQNLRHSVGFGSTEFHVLRPSPEVDGKYLFYMIWNPMFRNVAERNMTGTAGQKRVPSSFLKDFKIPLPPLPEQKRIAAILDKADFIWRKRQEAVRLAEELLRSVFLDMFGDPVMNPKGWEKGNIETILQNPKTDLRCGPFGTQLKVHELVSAGVPLFGIESVRDGKFHYNTKKFLTEKKALELCSFGVRPGDVLVTRMGTIGEACVVPEGIDEARISYHLFRIRTNQNKCLPEFLAATIFQSGTFLRQLKNMAHGAIMDGLSTTNLREVYFLVPPINEQEKYVKFIKKAEISMKFQRKSVDNSNFLFDSLVKLALEGNLSKI